MYSESGRPFSIESLRAHQGRIVLLFRGLTTRNDVESLVGMTIYGDRSEVPLKSGEYFDSDLIGLEVRDALGRLFGNVVGVEHFPGSDMLFVGEGRRMLPLIAQFISRVDLANKQILVSVPPGLLDDDHELDDGPNAGGDV